MPGTPIQNCNWISDQLASPLFESAARVRDDVAVITVTRFAFYTVNSLHCIDRHTRSEERAIWYPLPGTKLKTATWISDQLASPLFESAARVRDDVAVITVHDLHFTRSTRFTVLIAILEVRNELSGIHCLALQLKTATWISDQLASPLFESAARVRDDVAVITVHDLHFTRSTRFTVLIAILEVRNELSGIHCLALQLKTATWISDQLASPLFESAARVRDDVAVTTVTRLAFHSVSSLHCRDRHTRSEERAIWYSLPGIPIKNCNMDLGSIGFAALRVRCAGPR